MHDHLKKSVKFRAVEFVCAGMKLVLSYLFSRQGMPFMAWLVMHGSSIQGRSQEYFLSWAIK
jgi:hypothetical protein